MADENFSLEEKLEQKQRKELKELQAEIQRLKHSIPKGDKKKKKEVTAQIAVLQADLDAKHEKELQDLKNSAFTENVANAVDNLTVADAEINSADNIEVKPKKQSKAAKRREKKSRQEKERAERIQEGEKENLFGARHIETKTLKDKLKQRQLCIKEISSDGNCLYAAVADQGQQHGVNTQVDLTVESLRKETARYMRSHMEEFIPFLCNPDTGDMYTSDEFEQYCHKLETSPEWGGQLEITALSHVLNTPIEVIQADTPSVITGDNFTGTHLLLTYHRHYYGLGEHYNSVKPYVKDEEEEEEGS